MSDIIANAQRLVEAIRQQLHKLETMEERELVKQKLDALFGGQ